MKKIYQIPTMQIVSVRPMQMIAESVAVSNTAVRQGNTILSKGRRGIFQDDASEEEQSIW